MHTVFDSFFNVKGSKHPNIKKFVQFVKHFSHTKKTWAEVAVQGAASLVPLIIGKVRTDMMPYRLFIEQLKIALEAEHLSKPDVDPKFLISNSLFES